MAREHYVTKVTREGGIMKDGYNAEDVRSVPVHIPQGNYILENHDGCQGGRVCPDDCWRQADEQELREHFRPIDGQEMGEDGLYEGPFY